MFPAVPSTTVPPGFKLRGHRNITGTKMTDWTTQSASKNFRGGGKIRTFHLLPHSRRDREQRDPSHFHQGSGTQLYHIHASPSSPRVSSTESRDIEIFTVSREQVLDIMVECQAHQRGVSDGASETLHGLGGKASP